MLSDSRVRRAVKVANIVAMAAGYLLLAGLLIGLLIEQQAVGLGLSRTVFRDPVHAAMISGGYQWDERLADEGFYIADAEGLYLALTGPSHDLDLAILELYACPCDDRAGVQALAAESFIGAAFPDLNAATLLQELSRRDQTHVYDSRVLRGWYTQGKVRLLVEPED